MKHRNPNFRLAIYILLLAIFAAWMVYHLLMRLWFAIIPALGMIWISYNIFKLFRRLHEKVTYFFNAVENEDSTLYFPEDVRHKPTKELNQGLNRMNQLIQEVKVRNHEQEQFYGLLLEQVATGIIVVDESGRILQANSPAKTLLNYHSLTHIEQLKRVDSNLYQSILLLKEQSPQQLVKLHTDSITRNLSLHATTFQRHGEKLRIISIHDISNEMDAIEIESWQKIIRMLTHEIMNSIAPITSLSETLLGYYTDPQNNIDDNRTKNTIKGLDVIHERGIGLIRFVESYRTLTKLSEPVFKPIRLHAFIEKLLALLQAEAKSRPIDFDVQIDHELCIEGDEVQLSQALINLFKNAIEAVETVQEAHIIVKAVSDDEGYCRLSITDNGHGIPPEILDQIFVPFFSTRENGSGIGLSLTRQIIRNHGGKIEVSSTPGSTTFGVYLQASFTN